MIRHRLILLSVIALAAVPPLGGAESGAGFLRMETGARPAAMAGAYTALTGDISSLWHNPGSLALAFFNEAQFSHNEIGEGMRRGGAALLLPSAKLSGSFAASFNYFDSGKIEAFTPGGVPDGTTGASAFAAGLAFATRAFPPFYPGVNLRFVSEKLHTYRANALAADIGVIWQPPVENLTVGASALNIGSGLEFIDEKSPLPLTYRAGTSYSLNIEGADFAASADYVMPYGLSGFPAFGAEIFFYRLISLRAGWTGSDDLSGGLRLGGGLKTSGMTLDYAWIPRGDFTDSHRISIGMRFGKKYSEEMLESNLREHFERAEKLYRTGRILEAYREFRNILLVAPRHAAAGEYVSRIEISIESLELRREIQELFASGVRNFDSGDLTASRAAFETVLVLDPNHAEAERYIYRIENRFREVANTITDRAEAFYERAEYESALEETGKALAIEPDNARALELNTAAIERIRELEERREAQRKEQEERIRRRNIASLVSQGNRHFERRRWLDAANSFRGVLEMDPANAEARRVKADSYTELAREMNEAGNMPEALEFYRKAQKHNAPGIEEEMGSLIGRMRERADELNRTGLIAYAGGRLKEAESCWEKALTYNPELAEARENLARVRRELR